MFIIETAFISEQITEYRFWALLEIFEKFNTKLNIFSISAEKVWRFHDHTVWLWKTQWLGSFAWKTLACTKVHSYLLIPGASPNDPKPAKTIRNQPKRPKKNEKQPEETENVQIGEIWNFLLTFVFQTLGPNAQIWVFCTKKYQLSNLLTKFCLRPILKILIWHLTLFFQKFVAQMPKFGYFGQRSINFVILTKFCMHPTSKVLISNRTLIFENFEPKSPNLGILEQKVSTS